MRAYSRRALGLVSSRHRATVVGLAVCFGTTLVLDGRPVLAASVCAAVVVMVVVTTLVAPPALRWRRQKQRPMTPPC
jgi:hypothetical protein